MAVSGRFVDGAAGPVLMVSHEPVGTPHAALVVFPALGEEMNKSRRLVWSLGQRLAAAGVLTVIPDLYGTGDSGGDFRDASWATWCADMALAVSWARERCSGDCHALLVRFGALLYASCARDMTTGGGAHRVAGWQPEYRGADTLRQLLRMKVLADRVTWGRGTKLAELREDLADAATPTEVGGYEFPAGLAAEIEAAEFDWSKAPEGAQCCLFDWGPAAQGASESHASAVPRVQVEGQRFWSAVEPGDNAFLVGETAAFLKTEG